MSSTGSSMDSSEWMLISKTEESLEPEKLPALETSGSSYVELKSLDTSLKNYIQPESEDGGGVNDEKFDQDSVGSSSEKGEKDQGSDINVNNSAVSLRCNESDFSDVDILDELEEEDVTKQAENFPNFPVIRRKHSVGVMTQDFLTHSPPCSSSINHFYDWLEVHDNRLFLKQIAVAMIFASCSVLMSVFGPMQFYSNNGNDVVKNLAAIEDAVLQCLGQQYVNSLGAGKQGLDFGHLEDLLCVDEENHYTDLIRHLNRETTDYLIYIHSQLEKGVELPQVKRMNQRDINLSLILHNLKFKNILPQTVDAFTPEKLREIQKVHIAKTAIREVLEEEVKIMDPIQDITKLLSLNNRKKLLESLKYVMNEDGTESNSYMSRLRETKELIRSWLKSKSQFMGTSGSSIFDAKQINSIEEKLNEVKALLGIFERFRNKVSDVLSNIEEVNDKVQYILVELDKVEDSKMRNDEENIEAIVEEDLVDDEKDDFVDEEEESNWSWESIKKVTEKTFADLKRKIRSEHKNVRRSGYYKAFKQYFQQENTKGMLNAIKDYFKTSDKKTSTDFAKEDDQATKDSACDNIESGKWSMWSSFLRPFHLNYKARNVEPKESEEDTRLNNDWMFKRATERKEIRESKTE